MSSTAFQTMELLDPAEIARAAQMFENLKLLRLKLGNGDEHILERAFELHVQGVLDKLEQRWQEIADPEQRTIEVLMARHGLYDAAFQQVALLCQSISPALGDAVKDLRMLHASFMMDFHHCTERFVELDRGMQQRLLDAEEHIARQQDDAERLKEAMLRLNEENDKLNNNILELRRHLRAAASEVTAQRELLATHAGADAAKRNVLPTFDTSLALYGEPQTSSNLNPQTPRGGGGVNGPSTSNAPNAHSLRRSNSGNSLSLSTMPTSPRYMQSAKKKSASMKSFKYEELDLESELLSQTPSLSVSQTQTGVTPLNTPRRGPLSLRAPPNWLKSFREDVQRCMDSGKCRPLTLKEMREGMARFLESKRLADDKAQQGIGNVPRETLEQHIFREMEKKYGLRSLAVEHAATFLLAIERNALANASSNNNNGQNSPLMASGAHPFSTDTFAQNYESTLSGTVVSNALSTSGADLVEQLLTIHNNDVHVFRCVLRNEVEEPFLSVQRELATAIRDLTHAQIVARYPNRDVATQTQMVSQRLLCGTIIEEDWLEIVNYLYAERDRAVVANLLRRAALADTVNNANNMSVSERETESTQNNASLSVSLTSGRPAKLSRSLSASYTVGVPHTPRHSQELYGTSGVIAYDRERVRDQRRLGYSSSTLKIATKDPLKVARERQLRLSCAEFVGIILDFQLESHREYLAVFVKSFRDIDRDVDGVLSQREFGALFIALRRHAPQRERLGQTQTERESDEEREMVRALLSELDPLQSDRIPFSTAVVCLQALQQMENNNNNSGANNSNNNTGSAVQRS